MRRAPEIQLAEVDRSRLESVLRSGSAEQRLVLRATIVLKAAAGAENQAIAKELGVDQQTVSTWRRRYAVHRFEGIESDAPRSGRPREISAADEKRIIEATSKPPLYRTHWSQRSLAQKLEVPASHVRVVWDRHKLRPHIVKRFKISNDPHFEEKVVDVVGLYLDPPDKSIVLCVDEKTQIQALDRTRPRLKLRPGLPEHQTHDYKRNGQTNLFAALIPSTGQTIHQFHNRNSHAEFIEFLEKIDANTPVDLDLHIVADNSGTHKTPEVKAWLAERPRFHMHFTPTSSSWMNMVERIFGSLTAQQIRRGTFEDVASLQSAIGHWFTHQNEAPRPYKWAKTAAEILRKVAIYRRTFNALH